MFVVVFVVVVIVSVVAVVVEEGANKNSLINSSTLFVLIVSLSNLIKIDVKAKANPCLAPSRGEASPLINLFNVYNIVSELEINFWSLTNNSINFSEVVY